ncbi:MAG: HalOD1 output domain-containing protein [Halolamina sp.]
MTSQRNVARTDTGAGRTHVEDGDVTARIVSAVAKREGIEPTALDSRLYEAVDPDALSMLVDGSPDAELTLGFNFAGYRVTVVVDDEVAVDVAAR